MIEAAFTGRQFGVACAAAMLIVAVLLAATYALRRRLRPLFPSPLDLP
jgi:ABC-type sugar transport system permease subunit